jgi:hypothetical protein
MLNIGHVTQNLFNQVPNPDLNPQQERYSTVCVRPLRSPALNWLITAEYYSVFPVLFFSLTTSSKISSKALPLCFGHK